MMQPDPAPRASFRLAAVAERYLAKSGSRPLAVVGDLLTVRPVPTVAGRSPASG